MNFSQAHSDYLDPDNHLRQHAEVDVDEAYCVSAGDDSVYFQVEKSSRGWWMSAIIDSDTGHFVDTLYADDGPYKTETDAQMAGLNCAAEWMSNNSISNYEVDQRLKHLLKP